MPATSTLAYPSPLLFTLEAKVKLLISQTLVLNLEISQLQQEIACLRAQSTDGNTPKAESHRF